MLKYESVSVVFDLVESCVEFVFQVGDVLSKSGFILVGFCCVFATVCAEPV